MLLSLPLATPTLFSDFSDDEYIFGRSEDCDYCFERKGGVTSQHYPTYSSTHFRIYRVRGEEEEGEGEGRRRGEEERRGGEGRNVTMFFYIRKGVRQIQINMLYFFKTKGEQSRKR